MIGGNIVAYIYLLVVFNRMRFAFFDVNSTLKERGVGKSAFAAIVYFFIVMFVALGNSLVPELGLADDNLARLGYEEVKNHGGLFSDEPQTAICAGFFYYFILALFTMYIANKWDASAAHVDSSTL